MNPIAAVFVFGTMILSGCISNQARQATRVPANSKVISKSQEILDLPPTATENDAHSFLVKQLSNVADIPGTLACSVQNFPVPSAAITDEEFFASLGRLMKPNATEGTNLVEIGKKLINPDPIYLSSLKRRSSFRECGLTDLEIEAIGAYTGSAYVWINSVLRDKKPGELIPYSAVIETLKSGLAKLGNYDGWVFRGSGNFDLQNSGEVHFSGFISTSLLLAKAKGGGEPVVSAMRVRDCKYIAPISVSPGEEEVLCPPGLKFSIRTAMSLDGVFYRLLEEIR